MHPNDNENENIDFGFYSKNDSNCSICRDKCSSDNRCGAYECGGTNNICAWWAVGQCTARGSPSFFEYNKTTSIMYGVTCWKGKSVLRLMIIESKNRISNCCLN